MPSVFLFSFSLLLLSFPSYHLRAPSLHGRDAVHKVRGLALVRLLFFSVECQVIEKQREGERGDVSLPSLELPMLNHASPLSRPSLATSVNLN